MKNVFAFQKKIDDEKAEKKAAKLAKFIADGGEPPKKKVKPKVIKGVTEKAF